VFNFFQIDIKKALLIIFVISLPLLSINLQRGPDEPAWYLAPVSLVSGVVVNGYANFSQGVRSTLSTYVNLIDIKKENRLLTRELDELKAQLNQLEELKLENQRLNKAIDFQQKAPMKLVAAKVTGLDLMLEHRTIRINRGTEHGVTKGQAVITFDGVVGYIYNAEPRSSQVLVLTDRYAVIDGIVQRTRARGIVAGRSVDRCQLKYLHRSDDVVVGDLVVSSGLDNIFPKGFPVARVISVEKKNYGVTQKVELEPVVDPSRLEEIFVVIRVNNEEPLQMTQTTKQGG